MSYYEQCYALAKLVLREQYPASSDDEVADFSHDIHDEIRDYLEVYYFDHLEPQL